MAEVEAPRTQFIRAKIAARLEIKHAVLDKTNPRFASKYASLTSVLDACVLIYAKHGITIEQRRVQKEDGSWVLQTWRQHVTGERDELPDEQSLTEGTDQQRGSSLTYARRYGVSTVSVISSEDDDDANEASNVSRETKPISARQSRLTGFYPTAEAAIRNQPSLESLKQWWIDNQDEIRALAPSWIVKLEEEKDRRKLELIDEIGNEEEMTDFKKKLKESLHDDN